MKTFIDKTEDGFQAQVDNFLTKAPNYPDLGLAATELTELRKDWTLARWLMQSTNSVTTYNKGLYAFKNTLRDGGNLGALPSIPELPAAPAITSGGMEKRFRDLIQDAVRSPAMTEAIAKDLGILAPESSSSIDASTAKPSFNVVLSSGGYPMIVWKKGGFEGIEIQKSKDGINFSRLDRDYKPDFIDKSDLPAPAKAEVWYYKLIYLTNETEPIGQWSDVQSVSVAG